ncbi:translation initiation factor IF-2-like [Lutra lutra]|uniref:translation initiation factor IF-2-like n=1 Tax=Lutra lutra TaxID=9657 RepID=UPI001FCFD22F|nr:translation initiation factor IF-2-like [Lutra lutra]
MTWLHQLWELKAAEDGLRESIGLQRLPGVDALRGLGEPEDRRATRPKGLGQNSPVPRLPDTGDRSAPPRRLPPAARPPGDCWLAPGLGPSQAQEPFGGGRPPSAAAPDSRPRPQAATAAQYAEAEPTRKATPGHWTITWAPDHHLGTGPSPGRGEPRPEQGAAHMEMNTRPQQSVPARVHWRRQVQSWCPAKAITTSGQDTAPASLHPFQLILHTGLRENRNLTISLPSLKPSWARLCSG